LLVSIGSVSTDIGYVIVYANLAIFHIQIAVGSSNNHLKLPFKTLGILFKTKMSSFSNLKMNVYFSFFSHVLLFFIFLNSLVLLIIYLAFLPAII